MKALFILGGRSFVVVVGLCESACRSERARSESVFETLIKMISRSAALQSFAWKRRQLFVKVINLSQDLWQMERTTLWSLPCECVWCGQPGLTDQQCSALSVVVTLALFAACDGRIAWCRIHHSLSLRRALHRA